MFMQVNKQTFVETQMAIIGVREMIFEKLLRTLFSRGKRLIQIIEDMSFSVDISVPRRQKYFHYA